MAKNNKAQQAEILSGRSKDIRGELLEALKKTAPGEFTEGKVDFDRLRAVLAERVTKKFMDKVLESAKGANVRTCEGAAIARCEQFTCLDTAFKNNDPLKTNAALQMEATKIEFKVI